MTAYDTRQPSILAWHGDPDRKAAAVQRMAAHRAADEIVQGTYGRLNGAFGGCFHGCLTVEALAVERGEPLTNTLLDDVGHGYTLHVEGERLWGIPQRLGHVLDSTFESLSADVAGDWAVRVTDAIPVGADLSLVVDRWLLDILADDEHGVRRHTAPDSAQRKAVDRVTDLYRRRLAGDEPAKQEWRDARYAANAATVAVATYAGDGAAADAATYAGDGAAADAATYATVAVATYAGDGAAADAATYAGAYTAHWRWMADRLVHHLATAPVPTGSAR